ncbi:MAG: phosphate ABC transporter permease PstA [Gammaproteobacteria bacterium]
MSTVASVKKWIGTGSPWVWLSAGMVSLNLVMVFGLLALIAFRGLGHFWPAEVAEFKLQRANGETHTLLGTIVDEEEVTAQRVRDTGVKVPEELTLVSRYLIKVGNRDITGADFVWINELEIIDVSKSKDALVLEREEWGNFYGYLKEVKHGEQQSGADSPWQQLTDALERKNELRDEIERIERQEIGEINYAMERLRLAERGLELDGVTDKAAFDEIVAERALLQSDYEQLSARLGEKYQEINRDKATVVTVSDEQREIEISDIVRAYRPNDMNWFEKVGHYIAKVWEFVADDPREANTEGGVYPAIFGTVLLVLSMSVFVTPFGVIAAIYLREYAHQGLLTRIIRIAVNNLAGVPSVVYGVFGLGFFVYFLGGNIDRLFFPEALPAPTFGTPGLLWSSLTLAILTVPVVIVSTEEGLTRIPRSIREGSLALGATKAETLWRTVLPMATPAMMTGLILSVARAAGEVAPLMMVGVVKLAPSLPMDGNFPYMHLDRKFMHLGFHIYDVGFQSPNVEAARPLVYATALLLIILIVALNIAAIRIRNQLREKYSAGDS